MSDANETPQPPAGGPLILTINGGSSSIKFAAFSSSDPPTRRLSGQVERIGEPGTQLVAQREAGSAPDVRPIDSSDYRRAGETLIKYLRERLGRAALAGIGHRIVHGGVNLVENQLITPAVLGELRQTQPLDLAHLPREISLIEAFGEAYPALPQVACFDTAFHRDMPGVARMLPIPRHYHDAGIRRLGFHGLSYTYLMMRLAEIAGAVAAKGRIILAHLGSGASMAAVRCGKPIDTTMAFTPTAGLVMGTRPGDLDPGLLVYLMRVENLTADQLDDFISRRCGLLGVSQTSFDMRVLLNHRAADPRAADAVDLFCYQARKFIGALSAALGGLDTLIFAGGIGEHSPQVRAEICEGLEFLGLDLDSAANAMGHDVISARNSRVTVRVIPTDEEVVIARAVRQALRDSASTSQK
ncbi:MAG TPA: acetate/propionate family kinase [Tepidisphaeraceae bacterium]|nr:acetate/propionate family kinase [Tepidisphaeraceae bacterium]